MRVSAQLITVAMLSMATATNTEVHGNVAALFQGLKVGRAATEYRRNPSSLNEVREHPHHQHTQDHLLYNPESDLHIITRGSPLRRLGDIANRILEAESSVAVEPQESTISTEALISSGHASTLPTEAQVSSTSESTIPTEALVSSAHASALPTEAQVSSTLESTVPTEALISSTHVVNPTPHISKPDVESSSTAEASVVTQEVSQRDTTETSTTPSPTTTSAATTRTPLTCRKGGPIVGDVEVCQAGVTSMFAEHESWCKGHCAEVLEDPSGTPFLWCQIVGICDLTECVYTFWSTACKPVVV